MLRTAGNDDLAAPIDPGCGGSQLEGNALGGVRRLLPDPVRFVTFADQHSLGERGPFVWKLPLLPNPRNLALVSPISKRDGGRRSPQRSSDNDDAGRLRRNGLSHVLHGLAAGTLRRWRPARVGPVKTPLR